MKIEPYSRNELTIDLEELSSEKKPEAIHIRINAGRSIWVTRHGEIFTSVHVYDQDSKITDSLIVYPDRVTYEQPQEDAA